MERLAVVPAALLALSIAVPASAQTTDRTDADDPLGSPAPIDQPGPAADQLSLSVLGTHHTDVFDESAAEIVAHDPATQRLYVVNAQAGLIDVLDVGDPTSPDKIDELASVVEGGTANSVAVNADGLIAVAIEDAVKTDPGTLELWRFDGDEYELVNALPVGALPDMVTFTPDGATVLTANEGEPDDDFTLDPEGSVSIVDVSGDVPALNADDVRTADFRAFDAGTSELPDGVRVFGPDVPAPDWQGTGEDAPGRIARNLEPEYVVAPEPTTAYVTLQEANTIAVLDVVAGEFTDLLPLGRKDHLASGNELAVSDRDDDIRIRPWPVLGIHQPDGFDVYEADGATYLVTANEGDARDDWGDYEEGVRAGDLPICEDAFEDVVAADEEIGSVEELFEDRNLGRLTVSSAEGLRDGQDCYEQLHVPGARSFSIFDTAGRLVFDSGSDFERVTAAAVPEFFNSNHNENSFQTRSDDKGPEPEDVTIGEVDGRTYAFIGLERIGGVIVYDITDPTAPQLVRWVNNRDLSAEPGTRESGDQGAEGLIFIPAEDSPIDAPLLAVANEVSGTTTLFRVDGEDAPTPAPEPPFDRGIARVCDGTADLPFVDVAATNVHRAPIACFAVLGLTSGSADPARYEPARPVTRGQVASFLVATIERATGGPLATGDDPFTDDDGSVHEEAIGKLAAAGVVTGVTDTTFGPTAPISRAQMASVLDRTLDLLDDGRANGSAPPRTDLDVFDDDGTSVHAGAIDRLAAIGVVQGVGGGAYQPDAPVRRDAMATFVLRTYDAAVEAGSAE